MQPLPMSAGGEGWDGRWCRAGCYPTAPNRKRHRGRLCLRALRFALAPPVVLPRTREEAGAVLARAKLLRVLAGPAAAAALGLVAPAR